MLNKLKEMRALNAFARKQSVGMQHKLMFYWLSMILTVFALVMLLLSAAGTVTGSQRCSGLSVRLSALVPSLGHPGILRPPRAPRRSQ